MATPLKENSKCEQIFTVEVIRLNVGCLKVKASAGETLQIYTVLLPNCKIYWHIACVQVRVRWEVQPNALSFVTVQL